MAKEFCDSSYPFEDFFVLVLLLRVVLAFLTSTLLSLSLFNSFLLACGGHRCIIYQLVSSSSHFPQVDNYFLFLSISRLEDYLSLGFVSLGSCIYLFSYFLPIIYMIKFKFIGMRLYKLLGKLLLSTKLLHILLPFSRENITQFPSDQIPDILEEPAR